MAGCDSPGRSAVKKSSAAREAQPPIPPPAPRTARHAVRDLPSWQNSAWDLLEHIRITQRDLLDFVQDPDYEEKLQWPRDYWPTNPAPASDKEWNESIAVWKKDRQALERFTTESDLDLTTRIPRGTGQTYLRTILVAVDHASYHLAQIITVRQLLGAWPPAKGK